MTAPPLGTRTAPISIEAFEAAGIDPDLFDHEAHVYVGWLYLRQFTLHESIERYSAALRRWTRMLGVPTKYNETITWFYLILINERMLACGTDDWESFKTRNVDLFSSRPSIISQYYSNRRLATPTARDRFVLPDLVPVST